MTPTQAQEVARKVQRKAAEWIGETGTLPCSIGAMVRDNTYSPEEEDLVYTALNQMQCEYLQQAEETRGYW
jgi:hypothetical protein